MTSDSGALRVWFLMLIACGMLAIASTDVRAQSTQPAGSDGRQTVESSGNHGLATVATKVESSVARGADESRPILRRGAEVASTTQPARNVAVPGSGMSLDSGKVMLSLGVVLALIFVLRWSAKRVFPGQVGIRSSRAVQVVSRSVLSPKQQFLLLQVGKRLIVVADTGANMSPLCQITDADEVAELLGQIRSETSESIGRNFMSLFGRNREKFETPPANDPGERAALLGDLPEGNHASNDEDAAVGMTREEISGLMDKVRMLSRQFKRS